MKRAVILAALLALLAGCATTNPRVPPKCKGEYTPINTPDKYPVIEEDAEA